jgi:hypothetical protein
MDPATPPTPKTPTTPNRQDVSPEAAASFRVRSMARCLDDMPPADSKSSSPVPTTPSIPANRRRPYESSSRSISRSTDTSTAGNAGIFDRMPAPANGVYRSAPSASSSVSTSTSASVDRSNTADKPPKPPVDERMIAYIEASELVREAKLELQIAEGRLRRARAKILPLLAQSGPQRIDLAALNPAQLQRVGGAGSIEVQTRSAIAPGPPVRLSTKDIEKAVVAGLKRSYNDPNPAERLRNWIEDYKAYSFKARGTPTEVMAIFRRTPARRFRTTMPAVDETEADAEADIEADADEEPSIDSKSIRSARSYPRSPRQPAIGSSPSASPAAASNNRWTAGFQSTAGFEPPLGRIPMDAAAALLSSASDQKTSS